MLYAALTFWLLVISFCAWGVHAIWSGLIKPRVVNGVLLPGTLIAQLGHVLGLLITGNAVQNTALMSDDKKGEPQVATPETPKIPVLSSILIGLLPLVACATALYFVSRWWGQGVFAALPEGGAFALPTALPGSLASVWDLLHRGIALVEMLVNAIIDSNLPNWATVIFLYLAICLTVRMAPFEGNRRGALGAIVLAGLVIGVLGTLTGRVQEFVISCWPILTFGVAMLLFLLLVSLAVAGIVGLVRILARNE